MRSYFVRASSPWFCREHRSSRRASTHYIRPQLEELEDRLALSAVWTPQGPGPLLFGQPGGLEQQGDPDVGAVNALVANPSNANILYAATASGGIWETTNATATVPNWKPILNTDQPNLSIGGLALSPLDPNTLYAGTGHFSNGSIGNDGMPNGPLGDGVLKSTDGGITWSSLLGQSTFAGQNIRSILPTAVNSPTGQVVLAGTVVYPGYPPPPNQPALGGVYLSMDGGQSWTRISGATNSGLPNGDVRSLVEDPTNPDVLYAGVIGQGIYESTDAGQTWQSIDGNIPNLLPAAYPLSGTVNLQLAIDASNGNTTLFALTGSPSSTEERAPGTSFVFYIQNPASTTNPTWSEMDDVPEINQDDQEGNNLALTADPNDPSVVWVTGSTSDIGGGRSIVYRGDSAAPAGTQWELAVFTGATGTPSGPGTTPTITHSDARYLGFDATGNLLLTSDGGIYKLVNPDSSSNSRYWVALTGTLQDTELYSVAYDSIDHIIVGGAQDNGMGVQPQPGAAAWNTVLNDDVTHVAVDNSGPTAELYGIGSQFLRTDPETGTVSSEFESGTFSTTGTSLNHVELASILTPTELGSGLSFADVNAGEGSYIPFALDSANPNWLVIGLNDLYLSTDQGNIIAVVTPPFTVQGLFTAVAFGGAPGGNTNPNVALAGTSSGQLFVSVNANAGSTAGGTFNLAETFPDSVVRSIAFDPGNWQTIYIVTTSTGNVSHLWQMVLLANGQVSSLTEITGNLDAIASQLQSVVAVNPAPGVTTLVAGGTGTGSGSVFRSVGPINGSATQWQLLGSGLPNVNVHDLVYSAADNVLVAATFGRGAWTLTNAAQALLPPAPPSPPSPPSPPPTSPATFPVSVQQQIQLNLALLPAFNNAQNQALLAQLFGVVFALAQQQSPTQAQQLVQQEATLILDLALSNMAAALADANALDANPLYSTTLGSTLGLIEGQLILSTILVNS